MKTRDEKIAIVEEVNSYTEFEDMTVEEACAKAGISTPTYYAYKKDIQAPPPDPSSQGSSTSTSEPEKKKPGRKSTNKKKPGRKKKVEPEPEPELEEPVRYRYSGVTIEHLDDVAGDVPYTLTVCRDEDDPSVEVSIQNADGAVIRTAVKLRPGSWPAIRDEIESMMVANGWIEPADDEEAVWTSR